MGEVKTKHKNFIYSNRLRWIEKRIGELSQSDKPPIRIATPPEFQGHPGVWTPEDLFVASVNSCIMTTFLYYAYKEKLDFLSYQSEAEGVLENVEGKFMFSSIKVYPKIQVTSDSDVARAKELIELSDRKCLISNSIKSEVVVTAEVLSGRKMAQITRKD